jgi:hypothetical protein
MPLTWCCLCEIVVLAHGPLGEGFDTKWLTSAIDTHPV